LGPRPRIKSVRRSTLSGGSVELRENELPAGATVGMVLEVGGIKDGARPRLDLNCASGETRHALSLAPDEPAAGTRWSFDGLGSLYLSLDPGTVGYAGCALTATIRVQPEGRSDAMPLGRVVRVPKLEEFTLTPEQIAPDTFAGVLKGRDLDLVEKTGWDAEHGVKVDAIPVPFPGEAGIQTLRVALPWPSPAPHAPLYIWLRGESTGRRTTAAY
jgi:hypothetical protein